MGKYSIKDLERLSGIKAHTIRIWEQRYAIISPQRTDTNIRNYSDDDLRKILNIAILNNHGYKISNIAKLDDEGIQQEVLLVNNSSSDYSSQINVLTIAMVQLDEDHFEKIISSNILHLGFEKTMLLIVHPFMQRIGIMWLTGSINAAQEHFISNLIRQKLIVAIDGQGNITEQNAKKFLLFCPEGELHELALLFANYIIRNKKFKVVYLGITVPLSNIEVVNELHQPDFFYANLTTKPTGFETQEYINILSEKFPNKQIILSGYELNSKAFVFPDNIKPMSQVNQFLQFLDGLNKN